MMKINRIINVVFLLFAIILSAIPQCWSTLSDKQLCYDPDCSGHDEVLSFDTNVLVTVYSKGAGLRQDLWGVEINGKRGYAPKAFLKEQKVYKKNLQHVVPVKSPLNNTNKSNKKFEPKKVTDKLKSITENVETSSVPTTPIDVKSPKELPNNVTPTHEVIDGTTLYLNPTKTSTQISATEVPQTAAVPNEEDTVVNLKVDSNKENGETNIFAKTDELPQKILNGKEEDGEQNISQKDNANDVVKNPEKTLADVIGIKIPNLIDFFNSGGEEVKTVEKETTPEESEVSEVQDIQLSKEQSVSEVEDVKIPKEKAITESQDVKLSKEQSVSEVQDKVAKEQDVKVTEEPDAKVAKDQGVKVAKEQGVKVAKEQVSPETQDVQLSKEQPVSEVQGVKVSKEEDVKVTKEEDVKVTKEEDVKVAKEQDVKVTKEEDVKVAKEQDVKATKEEDVKVAKEQDVKVTKEEDVKVAKEQDVKIAKEQDVKVTKEQDVKVGKEPDVKVPKEQNVKMAKEHVAPETQNVQLPKEQSVSEVQDVKISEEQVPPETQNVQLTKEQPVSDVQDVEAAKEQVPPETQDVQLTKEQSGSDVQDVEAAKEQIVTENQDVQLSKEQAVSEVQDAKTSKEETISETQDVKVSKEETVSEVQDLMLQKEHSVDNDLHASTSNDNTDEQTENILNTTVASTTVTVSNEASHTDSVPTVSANSSETGPEIALNITESTNIEYVNSAENAQFETRQAKLVENSNVSESNLTILDIEHDAPLANEKDVSSSMGLASLNIDKNIGEQSSNINFDTAHQPDPKNHSENVAININSQDTQVNEEDTTIVTGEEEDSKELQKEIQADVKYENQNDTSETTNAIDSETSVKTHILEQVININDNSDSAESPHVLKEYIHLSENVASINEFRNRNLLNAHTEESNEIESVKIEETKHSKNEALLEHKDDTISAEEITSENSGYKIQVSSPEACAADNVECSTEVDSENNLINNDETSENIIESLNIVSNYWMTFMYLIITATATLTFSLGYYYIENMRRDGQLIAKINKLEKDLLVSTKESSMLKENLKITKDKLTCIEDESFGSNEMVLSLKADLEASQNSKADLEDQVAILERDLESATEAGLELERMLREVLSSDSEDNPLAQSVEDLQTRLNAQQAANESLTSALNLKTQENESLSSELASFKNKCEDLEVELTRVTENLKLEVESKNSIQQTLTDKVQELEIQIKDISNEKVALQKQLERKEIVTQDLMDVINQSNSNLDLDKLYNVTHIKAEAKALLEERNELKIRLTEVEGAHNLLEEHMEVIKEEVSTLSEQCKAAEKEKKDAETRLEVLSNFFKEKEAQRQKEESVWLQQQGEVVSTVERIQTMQSEIQNYKQQIEMLKREILDQEREYENQISMIETKAREQWIKARQVERRLEESKVEAGQLRNRLTLIEKNINDVDPEAKLHRMEANGETATSPPLFIGAESSSSPIMFSGSSNVPPPPPPSYLHSLFPPYLPPPLPNASNVPPYEISQRPPPLGGRLSSPPPMPLHPPNSSRYDNTGSPPPMSPHLLPSFPNLRIPPPPFGNDHMPGPPPPPLGSIMPAPLGTAHSWGDEPLTPLRNSGYHLSQRERVRNHKGSLHSSGESLDKSHHNSKA
ncbi:transport and golgi organization 1 isoform X2 [Lasioglossum baleicum]|uniref:transport and golgi organization 1 isoform X2 n=1 Tax=Lasioglossum baleicum TaxID=434251 RepID=UPI003FCE329F